jgi:hypothetical protein
MLKLQFQLDDEQLEALKEELVYAQQLAVDEDGRVLVWTGGGHKAPVLARPFASSPVTATRVPLSYTPPHLTEKILDARQNLEGERKQVKHSQHLLYASGELSRLVRAHCLTLAAVACTPSVVRLRLVVPAL